MKAVCVFCGSKSGDSPAFGEAAFELGAALASHGLTLVYGGAQNGLMGRVADGALSGGGAVIGVIPRGLARQEFAHPRLTETVFAETMAERKQVMIDRSDAFIALPGGFGTLDELFEVLTGAQIGLHQKPIGVLNQAQFFTPLLQWVDQALARGFVPDTLRTVLAVSDHPRELVATLLSHQPPQPAIRWIR